MRSSVAIVLATYNGAAYVEAQVRSLQAQDFKGWQLFARDDGSTDSTAAGLERLASEDKRITLLESGPRLGVVGNFGQLMLHAHRAGADYVFPCDQDDVWQSTKMSRMLALIARLEAEHGRGVPLLVHSDLEVVDEDLRRIHPSFLRYQGIGHEDVSPIQVLLVQNFVTGCASLLNRPLLDLGLPIPDDSIMHDWWLAECAAAGGFIGFIPEATILYRQHAANQVGAASVLGGLNPLHAQGRRRLAGSWKAAFRTLDQARALHRRLREHGCGSPDLLLLLEAYAGLANEPPARRIRILRRLGIRRQGALSTALLYVRMVLLGVGAGEDPGQGSASG